MKHPQITTSLLGSLVFHMAGWVVLASVIVVVPLTRPRLSGQAGEPIVLTAARVQWTSPPLELEIGPSSSPVLIQPGRATVFRQHFVDSLADPAQLTDTIEIDSAVLAAIAELDRRQETLDQPANSATPDRMPRQTRELPPSSVARAAPTGRKSPPSFEHNPPPRYPDLAWQRRWEGVTLLRVHVDDSGRVSRVEVARSSGYAILDAAAVRAVRQWKGQPARQSGRSVATVELLPIDFRLN